MRKRWLSLKRLKMHEAHTTLRLLHNEPISWPQRSETYSRIQKRSIATFIKFVGPTFLGYFVATSFRSGDKIAFTISSYEVSASAAFFLFYLSVLFFFMVIALNNLSVALALKSSIAGKIDIPGFSILAYSAITEEEDMSLGVPVLAYGHWKEIFRISSLLTFLVSITYISLTIPFIALGVYLFNQQYLILSESDIDALEMIASVCGLLSVITGALSFIAFHVPIPFYKNVNHVRWGFLWKLPLRSSDKERTERWLKN